MHCTTVLQKLRMKSKAVQGQQVTQQMGEPWSLGTSIFPPANSCLPFAHICALWVHFKSADTSCMHVAAPLLHADCLHILHKHPRYACMLLHVHSSCLMHVLSHLACTLHAHSCPPHTLIPCTPHPTALPVLCLCIPLLPDALPEAEQINIYLCVYIRAALYIARNVGSFCGRSLSGTASSWWIICENLGWLSSLDRAGNPLEGPGGAGDGGRRLSLAYLCTI